MISALLIVIGMQLLLPRMVVLHPRWLLSALDVLLLIVLVATPKWIRHESVLRRALILVLIATINLANVWSAVLTIDLILDTQGQSEGLLLATGAMIWFTNVIVFALWYWELERNRPGADFLFPQMMSSDLAPNGWEATFTDYLYLSFTNSAAFSPTDVLPLSHWAKATMMLQAVISLSTIALIIGQAVNSLG